MLQISREIGNEEYQAINLVQLSICYMLKEDYQTALARSQEAEQLFRRLGIEGRIAETLHNQGLIFKCLTAPPKPLSASARAWKSSAASGTNPARQTTWRTGQAAERRRANARAIAAFNEALEIHQRLGSPKMGIALEHLGIVHEMQGEHVAALEKYEQARHIYQQAWPAGLPIIEKSIARVREKMARSNHGSDSRVVACAL